MLFSIKIFFLLWILRTRYSHAGKVCSGDFRNDDDLKKGSNYVENNAKNYTFDNFSGLILKLYVYIFLAEMFLRAAIAFWFDSDWNPFNEADNHF